MVEFQKTVSPHGSRGFYAIYQQFKYIIILYQTFGYKAQWNNFGGAFWHVFAVEFTRLHLFGLNYTENKQFHAYEAHNLVWEPAASGLKTQCAPMVVTNITLGTTQVELIRLTK